MTSLVHLRDNNELVLILMTLLILLYLLLLLLLILLLIFLLSLHYNLYLVKWHLI